MKTEPKKDSRRIIVEDGDLVLKALKDDDKNYRVTISALSGR